MACGIGVCMTCVLPVDRRGRPHPLLPVLRGGSGVRRRPGALRRRRHAAVGRRRRRRDGSGGSRDRSSRPRSTCRRRWAPCRSRARCSPRPGCSAFGQELEPFVDLTAIGAVVTKSVQLRPALGPADAADGRDPQRDAQLDRPAGARHRRPARRRPALAGRARRPGVRLDRRHPGRGLRRAGRRGCAACPACSASRSTSAARTSRAAARCSPATRWRPPTSSPRSGPPPTRPSRSTPSSAPTSPTS